MAAAPAIQAKNLTKSYGLVRALAGVNVEVEPGKVFGLLGPNGAGKTTLVRILTTLLKPDAGTATVAGYDVVRNADRLRSSIGLAGQYAALDETLTGRENTVMVGRLYHLPRAEAERRSEELLDRFDLADAADRQVRTYSGGMRRRLDLAASLVGQPEVLFLDEPTTGLDPRSRLALWDVIEELVKDGTTVLLTTQYLEEADRLANTIAVIDRGEVIAEGTPDDLKAKVGGEVLEVDVNSAVDLKKAARALADLATGEVQVDAELGRVSVPVRTVGGRRTDFVLEGRAIVPVRPRDGPPRPRTKQSNRSRRKGGKRRAPPQLHAEQRRAPEPRAEPRRTGVSPLAHAVRLLDGAGVEIADLALRRPTLDDVFLALTGHRALDGAGAELGAETAPKRARRRA